MKRKSIISATAACILSSGALVAVNVLQRNASVHYENDIEALADNEGCKKEGSGVKDGVCRTIGSFYICVDAYSTEEADCYVEI